MLNNFLFFIIAFLCIFSIVTVSWSIIFSSSKRELSSIKFRYCYGSDYDFNRIEGFGYVVSKVTTVPESWDIFEKNRKVANISVHNFRLTVRVPDKYGNVIMRYVVAGSDRLTDCDRIPKLIEAILLVRRHLTQNQHNERVDA